MKEVSFHQCTEITSAVPTEPLWEHQTDQRSSYTATGEASERQAQLLSSPRGSLRETSAVPVEPQGGRESDQRSSYRAPG